MQISENPWNPEFSELGDNFWLRTSGFYDEESGISWIFRNPSNFEELKNNFLLNRFLKFLIYFEAMDLNRSFLQS